MSECRRLSRYRTTIVLSRVARRTALLLLSGILSPVAMPVTGYAQSTFVQRAAPADRYDDYIAEASQRFGIPAAWVHAVMRVESAGNIRAISSAGAMGLMQVMPATWAELRERHGLGNNPYDPRDNILAGTAYLREMHDRYGSPGFLAAYNAGPQRYEQHLAGRPLPAETRAYVATLAPRVGFDVPTSVDTNVAPDPDAWMRAPLFAGSETIAVTAKPLQSGGRTAISPAAPSNANAAAVAPQPNGLFIGRSNSGRSQ